MSDKPFPETYYVRAYWGPRKASAEECAQRTAHFLNLLASADPFLAQWYKPARSQKDARKHPLMPPDLPTLTELFRRGVNRARGGPVFESLGFTFSFDNGGPAGDCAVLRVNGGTYSSLGNYCVLNLPHKGPNAERVLSAPVLTQVVRSMAVAWEPDWAVATSCDHRDLLFKDGATRNYVGWVMYVSRQTGRVPPLPAPVSIDPIEDRGTLVVLTPERLTANNPAHVELGRRVFDLLDRAGLLQPVM